MEQELARASKRASETGDGEGAGQNSSLHAAGGQQEEESECSEEAMEPNEEKVQEVEGQWKRGDGAFKFGFRVKR